MLKIPCPSKFSEVLRAKMWAVVADQSFRNSLLRKYLLDETNDFFTGEFSQSAGEGVLGVVIHKEEVVDSIKTENVSGYDLPWSRRDLMWHEGLSSLGLLEFLTYSTFLHHPVGIIVDATPENIGFGS